MAIAPAKQQANKNRRLEKHIEYIQGTAKYIKNKKHCQVVIPTGEAIECYPLPKGDLGAAIAPLCLKAYKPCSRL